MTLLESSAMALAADPLHDGDLHAPTIAQQAEV
jgi:hypothetical protein